MNALHLLSNHCMEMDSNALLIKVVINPFIFSPADTNHKCHPKQLQISQYKVRKIEIT